MLNTFKHKFYLLLGALLLLYVFVFLFFFKENAVKLTQNFTDKSDGDSQLEQKIVAKQKQLLQIDSSMVQKQFFQSFTDVFALISDYAKNKNCNVVAIPKSDIQTDHPTTKIVVEGNFFALFDLLKLSEQKTTSAISLYHSRFFTQKKYSDKKEKLYLELNFSSHE
jgi:hypothetical protein